MRTYRFFIIAAILVILGVIFTGPLNIIKGLDNRIFIPFSGFFTQNSGRVSNFFNTISVIKDLARQNVQLQQDNLNLKSQLAQLKEIVYENEILKKEIGFLKEQKNYELIPAQIVARSPSGYLHTVKINKGQEDGIREGAAVVSQGFLVGQVAHVYHTSSEVILIISSRSLIPVISQESRGPGLLKGGLGGLVMEDVPIDVQAQAGETILTSGLADRLGTGFPVGTIKKILSNRSDIFQKLEISSPVNFNRMEIIFVVK